jgi:hypothetical protein
VGSTPVTAPDALAPLPLGRACLVRAISIQSETDSIIEVKRCAGYCDAGGLHVLAAMV